MFCKMYVGAQVVQELAKEPEIAKHIQWINGSIKLINLSFTCFSKQGTVKFCHKLNA